MLLERWGFREGQKKNYGVFPRNLVGRLDHGFVATRFRGNRSHRGADLLSNEGGSV